MKRAAAGKRRDANEPAIISALRAVGASVEQLSGAGIPDLLVGYCGETFLFEVKTTKGLLTREQAQWWKSWRGHSRIVHTPDDALALIRCNARRTA